VLACDGIDAAVAGCLRLSSPGKHVHLARTEGTNDPCRLDRPQPDC
jgi:hypothetical protein